MRSIITRKSFQIITDRRAIGILKTIFTITSKEFLHIPRTRKMGGRQNPRFSDFHSSNRFSRVAFDIITENPFIKGSIGQECVFLLAGIIKKVFSVLETYHSKGRIRKLVFAHISIGVHYMIITPRFLETQGFFKSEIGFAQKQIKLWGINGSEISLGGNIEI